VSLATEREVAEHALAALPGTDAEKSTWPPVAARLRRVRAAAGMSVAQVAYLAGMTRGSYGDLEAYDDEVFTALDIGSLARLASALQMTPMYLLFGADAAAGACTSSTAIVERLRQRMNNEHLAAENFWQLLGWDLSEVLSDPTALLELNIVALRDVCNAIDVDWTTALLCLGVRTTPVDGFAFQVLGD
jgi:transcriptional regulator with XRE-family HTH domain